MAATEPGRDGDMTTVVLCGLGAATGVIGIIMALRPAAPSLRAALAELDQPPLSSSPGSESAVRAPGVRVDLYLTTRLATAASERAAVRSRLWPLLTITGRSIQDLCREVLLGAIAGGLLPGVWWAVVTAAGVQLPFAVPVWAGLMFGCAGALLPLAVLRSQAIQARRSARRVVGSFVNLVVLCLAGGMGIEGALHASARIGEDDVSERILNALVLAQDSGEAPWDALDRLGRALGVNELTELAAAVSLAGGEGARIRLTLAAKAGSIRRHALAEAESEANAVTERLFLPGIFLLVGFLVFIAYPAVARISSGL
jgi:tight adherence protein C